MNVAIAYVALYGLLSFLKQDKSVATKINLS